MLRHIGGGNTRNLEGRVYSNSFFDLKEGDKIIIYPTSEKVTLENKPISIEITKYISAPMGTLVSEVTIGKEKREYVLSEGASYRMTDRVGLQIIKRKPCGKRLHALFHMPASYRYDHYKNRVTHQQ